jgi:hypothetical protein
VAATVGEIEGLDGRGATLVAELARGATSLSESGMGTTSMGCAGVAPRVDAGAETGPLAWTPARVDGPPLLAALGSDGCRAKDHATRPPSATAPTTVAPSRNGRRSDPGRSLRTQLGWVGPKLDGRGARACGRFEAEKTDAALVVPALAAGKSLARPANSRRDAASSAALANRRSRSFSKHFTMARSSASGRSGTCSRGFTGVFCTTLRQISG